MIKKILIALLALLPIAASAQQTSGKWVTHARFAITSTQNVIDTQNKIYILVNNSLCCFDKTTKQQTVLSNQNSLTGTLITGIYYNYEKKYLVVTYDNSNIDVVYDNGKVVNLPQIQDAVMTQSRTINDVTFGTDKMFVATNFGFLVIDDRNMQIKETRVYSINISSIAEVGKWRVVFSLGTTVYYCHKNAVPEYLSAYKRTDIASMSNGKILPIGDAAMLVKEASRLTKVTIAEEGEEATFTATALVAAVPTNVQKTPTGYIANFFAAKYYYTFDAEGGSPVKKAFSAQELVSCSPDGDGALWGVNAQGVHSSAASTTYYKADAVSIQGVPFWMGYNKNTHKLYLTGTSDNGILASANKNAIYEINKFDGTSWESANPTGTTGSQGWYWPIFDPNDSTDTYYISSRLSGQFKVTDKAVVKTFNSSNTPWTPRKAAIRFDSDGNLWLVHSSLSSSVPNTAPVKVLPHDKVQSGNFGLTDWTIYQVPDVTNTNSFKYSVFDISNKSSVKAFCTADYGCPVIVWRNNPDLSVAEFESKTYNSLTATDGSTCTWSYAYEMKADLDDNILFGFDKGLVMFKATTAFNDDFAVEKVHALDGVKIYAVEVDTLNRKWVGTAEDGIYLLSPDCKTVISHFTSGNSQLATNVVYRLCCNTDNNSIFITTPLGVQQFFSDYNTSAEDFSNVYAYPNPVRPDFTGLVTITGLMDNSQVVIKDAKGQVVKTLTSTGSHVAWDCCDDAGERLPTGNYSVFAAQQGQEMPAQPYTKIMVIK